MSFSSLHCICKESVRNVIQFLNTADAQSQSEMSFSSLHCRCTESVRNVIQFLTLQMHRVSQKCHSVPYTADIYSQSEM